MSQLCDLVETQPTLTAIGWALKYIELFKNGFPTCVIKELDYIVMLLLFSESSFSHNHRAGSLFQDDLRGSFAVHTEVPIGQFDDGAHGLPDRVEGVDFVELLLWYLVSYCLIIPLQLQNQSQQAALRLVAHLLRQTAFLIWGLETGRGGGFLSVHFYFRTNISCNAD